MRGNPEGLGVRVERMIKTRKGLVVAVSGKEDAERLKTNEELKRKGYVVKDGLRKNPMIMVYDLEKGRVEEDTLKEIFQRNFRETSMSEMEFLRDVKVRRKIKQVGRQEKRGGKEKESWVIEVNGNILAECMRRERLYIGWESVRLKEYVDIVRCFKCQGYGHIGKVCRENKQICGMCAGEHRMEQCSGENEVRCHNCSKEGRRSDHPATYAKCEVYGRMVERYYKSVAYEN